MQNARDRLLLAAAELLQGGGTVSTRAVCDRAGVQAPTLYHHFGSKQGLIDAVANHGFTQYTAVESSGDPLDDLREGWDRHVRFGLEHPSFYGLLYGRVEPGRPCAITAPAHAALRERLTAAAARGMLKVPADDAAEQVLAANVGVTLTLISQPEPDFGLSGRVREAALAGVLHTPSADTPTTRASAALTLRALADDDPGDLTPGERGLLGELLDRLAR
ncbi:TetR/AcrR family transcriptional regulator [Micromonospora carbonacea]|uniref:Transcriptional regulator, TetR family n=1 Tax=Micromonospora carbonacea TaxID=47853 RepID=A0A1C5ASI4_9ACTN|nr:TetR/AcrR family transcriptional regulator [Micromonospora carbonacea]SCF48150.1 transcriptional regulator, TetR family [Micromonospora carbonacea]